MGGEQDDGQRRPGAADFFEQRKAVDSRQAHVADHDTRRIDGDLGQCLLGRADGSDAKTFGPQAHGQQFEDIFVVIDDQYVCASSHYRLPPSGLTTRGRGIRAFSILARLSSFSCNSAVLRWLSFSCWFNDWLCFSSWFSSFMRS